MGLLLLFIIIIMLMRHLCVCGQEMMAWIRLCGRLSQLRGVTTFNRKVILFLQKSKYLQDNNCLH